MVTNVQEIDRKKSYNRQGFVSRWEVAGSVGRYLGCNECYVDVSYQFDRGRWIVKDLPLATAATARLA